jgi:AP-3 complex subunit beta
MISKGKDASELFPNVAKNIITKNFELKKLVYMYLVHYAEIEQDASLLAINSLQKDLSSSNQYIRGNFFLIQFPFPIASALRAMSSIRVKIISQLVVLAIKKCVKDSSPYVRKTAAHALSKVYA